MVASAEPLVIEDARRHPLVRHDLAIPELQVVAYAGMPLTAAAADMSQLRTLLRGYAVDRGEFPSDTVQRLDRAMLRLPVDAIASIVLARIEPASPSGSRRLRWTNAGHPPPLLLPDGAVQVLRTPPDVLVGIDPTRPRRDHTTHLPVGSTLVLYTDGLIERRCTGQDIDEGTAALGRTLTGLRTCRPTPSSTACWTRSAATAGTTSPPWPSASRGSSGGPEPARSPVRCRAWRSGGWTRSSSGSGGRG